MWALAALVTAALGGARADMHVFGGLGDEAPSLGVGFGAGWPVGKVWLEGAADLGAIGPVGLTLDVLGHLRWYPFGTDVVVAPSLRVGPGLHARFEGGLWPEVTAGIAADLPLLGVLRPRLAVDGIIRPGAITGRLTLALVVGWAQTRPSPGSAVFEDPTGAARVWMPHPVCQWVPADEVDAWVGLLPPGSAIEVVAPGYVPVEAPAGDLAAVKLEPAPEHGSLVVVASPGDRIRVGDSEFVAPEDGVVVFDLPVGTVSVGVTHESRLEILEAAVADGYAVWVRSSTAMVTP